MGTRGLIGFRFNGVDKLTYNHLDSYPSGIGIDLLKELVKLKFNVNKMKDIFNKIKMVDEDISVTEEHYSKYKKYYEDYTTLPYTELIEKEIIPTYYELLRACHGTIEPWYVDGSEIMICNNSFLLNSLFCEWAYIINLDDKTFEVWEGFQHEPDYSNRYGFTENEDGYYPCKLIYNIPLKMINENFINNVFLSKIKELSGENNAD